ncbi:MAG: hypothetical protein U1F54_01950 [Burkholderiales bacterium]
MSGPITCGYFIFQGILVLAGRAIEEARAMRQEYGDVLARLQERERSLAEARDAMRASRVERIVAVRRQASRQAARFARLASLAQSVGVPAAAAPPAPAGDHDAAWTAHAAALDAAVRELEAALGDTGADAAEKVREALAISGETATIDDVLASYARQRSLRPGLDPAQAERLRATAARVLARLDTNEARALPIELETLAREIVLAPTLERAEALATELRRAVREANAAQHAQRADADEAKRLLAAMPEDAPAPLLRALEHVAAGISRLDAALRDAAQALLDAAAEARERAEQSAAAIVLTESLRDLGYEVEDIEATLFVDGGTTHFRRDGWENYFVRLRVDPRARSINFNVVRARGAPESAEQRRQDTLAEDRWCAEFPKLMQTLEARGLKLEVTRRLEAGAVPVQAVDPASLPRIAQQDDAAPRAAPRARPIA